MPRGTKECPYCGETIKSKAIVCRFCRRNLSSPPAAPVLSSEEPKREKQTSRRRIVNAAIVGTALVACCVLALAVGLSGDSSRSQATPSPHAAGNVTDTVTPQDSASPTISGEPTKKPTQAPTQTPTPAPLGLAVVINESINLRAGPGTDFEVVGTAKQGDELRVYAQNEDGSWLQVDEAGEAWIAAWIVEFDQGTSDVPVAPTPTSAPTRRPDPNACIPENALVWHAVSAVLLEVFQDNLQQWNNPNASLYTLTDNAETLTRACSNIPHPPCLDTLDENLADVLWNYRAFCEAMRDSDMSAADEALYWTNSFLVDYNAEYARLSALNGWSITMVEEWQGVTIGMCSDDVLKVRPASERGAAPENLGTSSIGLVVKWSYPSADLVFVQWERDGISCYRVRQIYLRNE